jgi:hypothetical protein
MLRTHTTGSRLIACAMANSTLMSEIFDASLHVAVLLLDVGYSNDGSLAVDGNAPPPVRLDQAEPTPVIVTSPIEPADCPTKPPLLLSVPPSLS